MERWMQQLKETYMQMKQQPTPGYDEAKDAAIMQPEKYDTQRDENGNPVIDPKTGNPLVTIARPEKPKKTPENIDHIPYFKKPIPLRQEPTNR